MKKTNDEDISIKLLDLFTTYSIEDSKISLKFLETQIKYYESERKFLIEHKPYSFQKKKMKEYYKKLDEIEEKIMNLYKDFDEEMKLMIKLQEPIEPNNKKIA